MDEAKGGRDELEESHDLGKPKPVAVVDPGLANPSPGPPGRGGGKYGVHPGVGSPTAMNHHGGLFVTKYLDTKPSLTLGMYGLDFFR